MNVTSLCKAVIHWVEFETLCGRAHLISEAHLAFPIGQFLSATISSPVFAEENHPVLAAKDSSPGRARQLDFVIKNRNEATFRDALETKWISDKRSFTQEVFNDLARLEMLTDIDPRGGRWFLVAGRFRYLRKRLLDATGRIGDGSPEVRVFDKVLPSDPGGVISVDVAESQLPMRRFWIAASKKLDVQLPTKMRVKLETRWPENPKDEDACCYIWRVHSTGKRTPFSFSEA